MTKGMKVFLGSIATVLFVVAFTVANAPAPQPVAPSEVFVEAARDVQYRIDTRKREVFVDVCVRMLTDPVTGAPDLRSGTASYGRAVTVCGGAFDEAGEVAVDRFFDAAEQADPSNRHWRNTYESLTR